MQLHFAQDDIPYTGRELSSHWIYRTFGILGDAVVAFVGPCTVTLDDMVDLEDVLNEEHIFSKRMLHFVVELFGPTLKEGVALQRLFSTILQDRINQHLGGLVIRRRGDDLFYNDTRKLSVSICTVSPTSILIHTGLNVDGAGAPVDAAGLTSDLKIQDIESIALGSMRTLAEEYRDMGLACCKVRAAN